MISNTMRFASLGGTGNFAQAGIAAGREGEKIFRAVRENSPDFQSITEKQIDVKSKQNVAQTKADRYIAEANINADAKISVAKEDIKQDNIIKGSRRKAGVVAAMGKAGMGLADAFMGKPEKRDHSASLALQEKLTSSAESIRAGIKPVDMSSLSQTSTTPDKAGGASSTSTTASSGGTSTNPITPSGGSVDRGEVYSYLTKDKGLSHNKAYGLMSNIDRESGFNASIRSGDDGGPGGLFQWKGVRQTPTVAKLVNSGDWKGQIDYALTEPGESSAQTFLNTTWKSPQDAAAHWTRKWERPADPDHDVIKNNNFIAGYTYHQ